jgi:hypothetical protein
MRGSGFRGVRAAVFALSAGAGLLAAPTVSAFCRGVTQYAPAGYDPAASGCWMGDPDAGIDYQLYWKNRCVSYSLQRDGTHWMPLQLVSSIAAQAFGAWSQVTCGGGAPPTISAVELEPPGEAGVACDQVQFNGYETAAGYQIGPNQNVIVFREQVWPYADAANTLGFTWVEYDKNTGEIRGADMEINGTNHLVPTSSGDPNQYDLLTVMTHEAGHFFGLAHSGALTAMMYAYYTPGASLSQDDVDGICSIYPSDGTRSSSFGPVMPGPCDPTPLGGFTSTCAPEDDAGNVLPPAPTQDAASADAAVQGGGAASNAGSCALAVGSEGRGADRFRWGGVVLVALVGLARRLRGGARRSLRILIVRAR